MSPKTFVIIGIVVGSYAGGFLFSLIFGGNSFSMAAIAGNLVGGVVGAWLAWRFAGSIG